MRPLWYAGIAVVVLCVAAMAVALVLALVRSNDRATSAAQAQQQINESLIRSCKKNGNPLREAVQQMLRDQIEQSHAANLEKFFPQIPPKQLHRLIHRANQQRRQEIQQIAPVDCGALYH